MSETSPADGISGEYFTDTAYTWGFYADFSPVNLNHIALIGGAPHRPLADGFTMLELGCGNGMSSITYAACYPQGDFHAVDVNAEHIDNARGIATAAGLDNITLHHASFADYIDQGGPDVDFIAFHGVYSWVSAERRREIGEIIRRRLKPGGLVYCSYNALPGWAAVQPLRAIMKAYTDGMTAPTVDKVREGLKYLKYLHDQQAGYFQNNSAASAMLQQMLQHDIRYIAHEYFPEYWTCYYFQQVQEEMAAAGLGFAGSVPLYLNVRDLSIPQHFRDMFQTAPNRVVYETHKSFVLNEMFRRDVYVKPPAAGIDRAAQRAEWDDMPFGPLVLAQAIRLDSAFPVGTVTYSGPVYHVLTRLLADRSMTVADMAAHAELSGFDADTLLNSLHFLCAGGQFGMLARPLAPVQAADRPLTLAIPLNRVLLERRLIADGKVSLASPVTGSGITVDIVSGLALLAIDRLDTAPTVDSVAEGAWAILEAEGHSLRLDGAPLAGRDGHLPVLKGRVKAFLDFSLPRLTEYGLLAPRG